MSQDMRVEARKGKKTDFPLGPQRKQPVDTLLLAQWDSRQMSVL